MKIFALSSIAALLTACNGYQAAFSSASSAQQVASLTPSPSTTLTSCQAGDASNLINQALSSAFLNLNINSLAGAGGDESYRVTDTISCPNGGTISFTATATTSDSFGYPQYSGSLSNGSGTLTFNACMVGGACGGSAVSINGTAGIDSISGSGSVSLSSLSFNAQGTAQVSSSLQFSIDGVDSSCDVNVISSFSADGSAQIPQISVSGSVTAAASGSVCGTSVNDTFQEPFSL